MSDSSIKLQKCGRRANKKFSKYIENEKETNDKVPMNMTYEVDDLYNYSADEIVFDEKKIEKKTEEKKVNIVRNTLRKKSFL